MSELKAGDRVRHVGGDTGVIVAGSDCSGAYSWLADGNYFRISFGHDLTPIRDTVTVTVELERSTAEWIAANWGKAAGPLCKVIHDAAVEALR